MTRPCPRDVAERYLILKYHIIYALTAPPREVLCGLMTRWSDDEHHKFVTTAEAKRDEFWCPLQDLGLWERLSPTEQDFAATTIVTMTESQQINATWRMEAAAVLLWALNLLDSLPSFDTQASHDLLKRFPEKSPSEFIAGASLRPAAVIDRTRDIAELWHWRSRTRKLAERGDPFPIDESAERLGIQCFDDVVRFMAKKAHAEGTLENIIDGDFVACGKSYRSLTPVDWSRVTSITMERHFALNWLCGYAPSNLWDETPTDT